MLVIPRTLRFRVVALLLVAFILSAGAFMVAMERLMVSNVEQLEFGLVNQTILGVRAAIDAEVARIAGVAGAMSTQNSDGNAVTPATLDDLGVDFVQYPGAFGESVNYRDATDTLTAADIAALGVATRAGSVSGLVLLDRGPAVVASRSLPGSGTVVAGRYLTSQSTAIAQLTQTELTLAGPDARSELSIPDGDQGVAPEGDDASIGWTVIRGLDGQPAMLALIRQPRPVMRGARTTLAYLRGGVTLVAVLVGLSIIAMVEGSVLHRLARLRTSVIEFDDDDDIATAVPAEGSDEIADLAVALNDTLGRIKASGEVYKHDSRHDHLTGLANRRALAESATRILASGGTDEHPCCTLVLLDLDSFKQINDDLGHQVGDEVLVWFAQHLREGLRADSTLCRIGGDEFAVLLPRTSLDEAVVAIERLREITSCDDDNPCFGMAQVRFSVGYAVAPDHGDTLEMLSQCADTDLYANKRGKVEVG